LATATALAVNGEIVNCDSMQLYRRLDIGTAKPSVEERALVPHHLYDLLEPDEVYSAGRYMTEARQVCADIASRLRVPVVVGGTGLYLRALLEGVFEGPGRSEDLRARLHRIADRKGTAWLHGFLRKRDPVAAARIQPADRIRIVRALEIFLATGHPITSLQPRREPLQGFQIVRLGLNLPRSELYARISRRVDRMFESGLVEEVKGLLLQGFRPDIKSFEALGYRHVVAFLDGRMTIEEARELTARDTRRYAKRQLTWFRRDPEMQWIEFPGEDPRALGALLDLLPD
jgi:tRNA dimethylallyltransferase